MNDGRQIDFEFKGNVGMFLGFLAAIRNKGELFHLDISDWNVQRHVSDGTIAYPSVFKIGLQPDPMRKKEILVRVLGNKETGKEEGHRFHRFIFDGISYEPIVEKSS